MAQDNDLEDLSASVAQRLINTPWGDYDSANPDVREEVHLRVADIREDLAKIADVDPNRALRIWDENVPDEHEAVAVRPEPDDPDNGQNGGQNRGENGMEPAARRRRRGEAEVVESPQGAKGHDRAADYHVPSPDDSFSSRGAYEDAIEAMEDDGIAEVERRMRERAGDQPKPGAAPELEAVGETIEVVTPVLSFGPAPHTEQASGPELDQSGKDRPSPPEPNVRDDRQAARQRMLFEGLEKRYLRADDKYHFRDAQREVAFEAQDKRLTTKLHEPAVITSMLDLAEARGWNELKLSGTQDFKREAWLQASLRGIEINGYRPDKLDHARLDELKAERGGTAANMRAEVSRSRRAPARSAFDEQGVPVEHEPKVDLSAGQNQVVRVLETIMRERGDSPEAIAKAAEIAAERFRTTRVHVGKLVDSGTAPYQDKPGAQKSHFVTLEDEQGRISKVWGVDMPRALQDSGAVTGERVVLAFGGRRQVTIDKPVRDDQGKVTGYEKSEVMRNTWDMAKFDRLRDDAKERVLQAAQSIDHPSKITVYDKAAPSKTPTQQVRTERPRAQERVI